MRRRYNEGHILTFVVADRFILNEQADILDVFKGKGDLIPIDPEAETL